MPLQIPAELETLLRDMGYSPYPRSPLAPHSKRLWQRIEGGVAINLHEYDNSDLNADVTELTYEIELTSSEADERVAIRFIAYTLLASEMVHLFPDLEARLLNAARAFAHDSPPDVPIPVIVGISQAATACILRGDDFTVEAMSKLSSEAADALAAEIAEVGDGVRRGTERWMLGPVAMNLVVSSAQAFVLWQPIFPDAS